MANHVMSLADFARNQHFRAESHMTRDAWWQGGSWWQRDVTRGFYWTVGLSLAVTMIGGVVWRQFA